MKTIEEKAKAYDEALEKAKKLYEKGTITESIGYIFPELKETEDEKIRKAILTGLIDCRDAPDLGWSNFGGIDIDECIAWLEKQGVKKIEPNLHVGDNKDNERLIKTTIAFLKDYAEQGYENAVECIDWLEKQGNSPIKWNKNTKDCKPKVKHSVLMETTHGIAEGEWQGEQWYQYRWAWLIKDTEVLSWIELSNLETQVGPPKEFTTTYENEVGNGNVNGLVTRKVQLPKFHKGEWIVWQDKCYKVNYNGCGYELVDQNGLSTSLEYGTTDENAHIWTIQDAEDGDVLCYKDEISLFVHDIKNCTEKGTTFGGFVYHCCYDGKRFITNSLYSLTEQDKIDIHPATKKQRELLFSKMEKEGYIWDAENKVLKKIKS